MNSGDPGSPRRRGPPRQAYQYVRPLAVTFAMPFRLTLTIARAELLQLTVKVVLHRKLGLARNDNYPAVLGDLHPRDLHTGRGYGLHRHGDISLPKCGRRASHGYCSVACLCAVIASPEFGELVALGAVGLKHPTIFAGGGALCRDLLCISLHTKSASVSGRKTGCVLAHAGTSERCPGS